MRFIGLDFGDKTVGVAVSDPEGRVAVGVETIRRDNADALKPSIRRIRELIAGYGAQTLVLGYPKNMDNTPSVRCETTLRFKEKLERSCKPVSVVLWDERLSTAAVLRTRPSPRAGKAVDEMAAVYILQGYLDHLRSVQSMTDEMNGNDDNLGFDENSAITMFDDEGNKTEFNVLATKEDEGCLYLLVAENADEPDEEGGDEAVIEVLHFKCVSSEDEEMVFELVDEEHEDFDKLLTLFKDDYEAFGIELDD